MLRDRALSAVPDTHGRARTVAAQDGGRVPGGDPSAPIVRIAEEAGR